jgi:hypothetical protein
VHRLIETRGLRFGLTGSSPRNLRRARTSLLAGRALTEGFFPLTVVESYFAILEDLLIGVRLPVFEKRAKRRLAGHPKFYL